MRKYVGQTMFIGVMVLGLIGHAIAQDAGGVESPKVEKAEATKAGDQLAQNPPQPGQQPTAPTGAKPGQPGAVNPTTPAAANTEAFPFGDLTSVEDKLGTHVINCTVVAEEGKNLGLLVTVDGDSNVACRQKAYVYCWVAGAGDTSRFDANGVGLNQVLFARNPVRNEDCLIIRMAVKDEATRARLGRRIPIFIADAQPTAASHSGSGGAGSSDTGSAEREPQGRLEEKPSGEQSDANKKAQKDDKSSADKKKEAPKASEKK